MQFSWSAACKGLGLAAALLSGCGGSGGDAPAVPAPGQAVIGSAGGSVRSDDGAEVRFPAGSLEADLTIRIAKDGTGAPPAPPAFGAASPIFAITPHGGDFRMPATVSLPVEPSATANSQQLFLATAKPGDTQWTLLSGATYADGRLSAPVMGFSYFRVVTIANLSVPTLISAMGHPGDWHNNVGGPGIAGTFAAGVTFNTQPYSQPGPFYGSRAPWLYARMSYPSMALRAGVAGAPLAGICRPLSYAHDGASWQIKRNGTPYGGLQLAHGVLPDAPAAGWPRHEGEALPAGTDWAAGFGALHYFGADAAGRGPMLPAGSSDPWPSPPPANDPADDTLTWRAIAPFNSIAHNGWYRIEVSVPTDCGFTLQAAPIGLAVNAPDDSGGGLGNPPQLPRARALHDRVYVGVGETARFSWIVGVTSPTLVRVEHAADPTLGPWQPVPEAWVGRGTATQILPGLPTVDVTIPNVQPAQRGVYRVLVCRAEIYCSFSGGIDVVPMKAPPVVTAEPQSIAVRVGEPASFSAASDPNCISHPDWGWGVTQTGCTVQWQKLPVVAAAFGSTAWTPIVGAVGNTYDIAATVLEDQGMLYRAVFTNSYGSRATRPALLNVVTEFTAPTVTGQPVDLSVTEGSTAVFVATIDGTPPFSYQWRRNGQNVVGANSATLTLNNVTPADAGAFDLVVSNSAGSVTTTTAQLRVSAAPPPALPPTITAAPASLTVTAGNAASFTVAASGTGPFSYVWLKNGQPIAGAADSPSYTIAATVPADAGPYAVRVSNATGTVLSATATLTVQDGSAPPVAPTLTTPPIGLAVLPGSGATFAVAASGSGPLRYQWQRNGTNIAGATGPVLHLAAVSGNDAGQYAVVVSNDVGSAASTPVPLVVIGAPLITQPPADQIVQAGSSATFTVAAEGPGLRYQWLRNGVAMAGATASSYTSPALDLADNGATFSVIVYNGAGIAFSAPATLTVQPLPQVAPGFTVQPANTRVDAGQPATLTFELGGSAPFTLQLQRFQGGGFVDVGDAVQVASGGAVSIATPALQVADDGTAWRVVVSNGAGSEISNSFNLFVNDPNCTVTVVGTPRNVNGLFCPNAVPTNVVLTIDFRTVHRVAWTETTPAIGRFESISVDFDPATGAVYELLYGLSDPTTLLTYFCSGNCVGARVDPATRMLVMDGTVVNNGTPSATLSGRLSVPLP